MKKYSKEIIILIIQMVAFYLLPFIVEFISKDAIVMTVFINMFITFVLTILLISKSKNKIKYLYPVIILFLFVPSGFVFYNTLDAVLTYGIIHLVISLIGLGLGKIIEN